MRAFIRLVSAAATLLCLAPTLVLAQTDWTRDPLTPVLPVGEAGAWDDELAVATTVMFHESVYKMWYEGSGGFGYATSPDGIVWTKHGGNPILEPGAAGAWDEEEINHPSVVFADGLYRMWYSGIDAQNDNRIGHATSENGIDWTRYGTEPVLDHGPPGSFDDHEVLHPNTLHEGGLYRMWYNGVDDTTQRILYAESIDGVVWTRYTDHPMLEPGSPGSWDDNELGPLCVLPQGDSYLMWYSGWNQVSEFRIGLAYSPDGIDWTKSTAHNPVLSPGTPGSWDGDMVAIPNVLYASDHFRMWYGGGGDVFQTGHATSPDVIAVGELPAPQRRFALEQNRPNPFNPLTTISYQLTTPATVSLEVVDASGRLVRRLIDSETRQAGAYVLTWDGKDALRRPAASGIYFYRLVANGATETRRMALIR